MEIVSVYFVLFSIIAIFFYYLLAQKYRSLLLTLLSCAFIASYSLNLLIYVIIFSFINFYIGLKLPSEKLKKVLFRVGILFNLLQLAVLKYASFAIDPIIQIFNDNISASLISEIIVPIGVSYFTLQGIGYLFNIKMGWEKPEKKFADFLLFIAFYPKFLSGPIERSNHFLPQLKIFHPYSFQQLVNGLEIALFGFFKKLAIADQLAPYVTNTFSNLHAADSISLVLLIVILPLYLYFDFSGYTDIAIGFSKTLGLDLLPNFNRPFFSENMTVFWKKFHISLSSWLNDYIFKQASFKYRKWGVYASVYGLLLTWLLFGVWHGASWNFMLLGLVQASAIIYEFFTKKWRVRLFSGLPGSLRIWISRIITYLFYGTSLVFFFSPDVDRSFLFFSELFDFNNPGSVARGYEIPVSAICFLVAWLLIEFVKNDCGKIYTRLEKFWSAERTITKIIKYAILAGVLVLIFVVGNNFQPLIYAQF